MVFRSANRTWLFAGMLCAVALSAAAQGEVQSGQASPFAAPADDSQSQPVANPFADNQNFSDEIQAPGRLFNSRPAAPLPPPQIPSPDLNHVLQDRKNWALMTPEEILGVATPEQILGVKKNDDLTLSSLTPEQRFLLRQDTPPEEATNQYYNGGSSPRWPLTKGSDNSENDNSGMQAPPDSSGDSPFVNFNRLLNAASGKSPFGRQGGTANWIQAPIQTGSPAKALLAQQAEMERFRQLLDPGSSASKPAATLPDYKFDSQSATANDLFYKKRLAPSPYAASFSAMESTIAKPIGLTSLPGIATEAPKKAEVPPAWAPKPPPWLSQEPNPFALPQPKL